MDAVDPVRGRVEDVGRNLVGLAVTELAPSEPEGE